MVTISLIFTICLILTSSLILTRRSLRIVTICLRSSLYVCLLLGCRARRSILCYRRCGSIYVLLGSLRCRSSRSCGRLLYGCGRLYFFLFLRCGIDALRLLRIARNHLHAGRGRRRRQRLNGHANGLLLRSSIVVTIIIPRSSVITTLRAILRRSISGTLSLPPGILLIIDNDDRFLLFRHASLSAALCGLRCGLRGLSRLCRLRGLLRLVGLFRILCLLCFLSLLCLVSFLCLVCFLCLVSLLCLVCFLRFLSLLCFLGLLCVS